MEGRLQKRYQALVRQHLRCADPLAAGPRAPLGPASAKAASQATWRFLRNGRVGPAQLIAPLQELARATLAAGAADPGAAWARYVLAVHDWSAAPYPGHAAKKDQAVLSNGNDVGYELATLLLVGAGAGDPIAPVEMRLRAAGACHSSRGPAPGPDDFRIDLVRGSMDAAAALGLGRTPVHVIDAEADSVGHYRDWHEAGHRFLVRADPDRLVRWRGRRCRLPEVVERLRRRGGFRYYREVDYEGKPARQYVASARVVLDQPAYRNRKRGPEPGRRRIPGRPLRLRLVVSELRGPGGELLGQWLLLTDVPGVAAAELALWYYWRWRIEDFFKLLKSAGQQLEAWLQRTALAVFKRLLKSAMACAVAWAAARQPGDDGQRLRGLLVRLSGRVVGAQRGWTVPALMAGLGTLVAVWDLLEQPQLLREVCRLKEAFWHKRPPGPAPPMPV